MRDLENNEYHVRMRLIKHICTLFAVAYSDDLARVILESFTVSEKALKYEAKKQKRRK